MCEQTRYINLPIDKREPFAAQVIVPEGDLSDGWTKQRQTTGRRKLWEIPHKYHCPVIGTCLHVDELRRLARKSGYTPRHALSDYELHVRFVAAANEKNAQSMALQRLLERKHAATVKRFARARTGDELERLWNDALANGEVKGALWAIMSHPHAPADMCMLAYADIHMLSHQIGAGLSADIKALTETRHMLADLRRDSAAERQRNARKLDERDVRIERLEQRARILANVEQDLALARERITLLESGSTLQTLVTREQTLTDRLNAMQHRANAACAEAENLSRRAVEAEQQRDALRAELANREQIIGSLERMLSPQTGCGGDCACCATSEVVNDSVDLRGLRILCVGGRGSLKTYYRDLVQRCNGELIRHDGGVEDNRKRLEALLARADAVVCPADCVSHDAYLRTKRYCKRHDKPCVLIDRSGIGAFADALSHLAIAPHLDTAPPANNSRSPQPA